MINIEKQIIYWREGATEDWQVAQDLILQNRVRHGLFFAHLAFEKLLKAHVCRRISDIAPRTHNLIRLAEIAEISLDEIQRNTLADMNAFNIEGRYPDTLAMEPSIEEANAIYGLAKEVFEWLHSQL